MSDKRLKAAALKYDSSKSSAPQVTAKGCGIVAEKIIEIAKQHKVPLREDRQLVEVLSALDLYQEIPPELYKAVAEILAYVYKMSKRSP